MQQLGNLLRIYSSAEVCFMTSDVAQTISSYWLGLSLTGTMSRIPQGSWKPPADNGASGWHRPPGPRQNNAAAAEVGPAEGNSLLPGLLRGGTLKQWKFPSSTGEQKKEVLEAAVKKRQFLLGPERGEEIPPADRNTLCSAGCDPLGSAD